MQPMYVLVLVVHVLAAAAWFGSLFYSVFMVQPRARRFFKKRSEFETFLAELSSGTRYHAIAALSVIAVTGGALLILRWPTGENPFAWVLLAIKGMLFLGVVALFGHVSWRMWPARIVALPDEYPKVDVSFRVAALTMLILLTLSTIVGLVALSQG